jgi:hypothetical protein
MKRMIVAGALALALMGVSQQQASAWSKFNFSGGFNICWERSGSCFSCTWSSCPGPYCGAGYGYAAPAVYAGPPAYDAHAYGPAYAPGYGYGDQAYAATQPAPQQAPAAAPAPMQQAGFYYYGYNQAPNYWYGR